MQMYSTKASGRAAASRNRAKARDVVSAEPPMPYPVGTMRLPVMAPPFGAAHLRSEFPDRRVSPAALRPPRRVFLGTVQPRLLPTFPPPVAALRARSLK